MSRVCVLEEINGGHDSLAETLGRSGYEVTRLADPTAALNETRRDEYDVILYGLKRTAPDGIEFLQALRSAGIETPLIVLGGETPFPSTGPLKHGAFDCVRKPFDADELCARVDRAVRMNRLSAENEALRVERADFEADAEQTGSGRTLAALRPQVGKAAASPAPALIQGEMGSGRETVARAIHAASPRRARPLLRVHCGAWSPERLEVELFGHERGAFAGAEAVRKGRLELADGGTLLLNEVGELPLPLQAKVLRVLQERSFERVGGSDARRTDVRLICTTSRCLSESVARRRFREDLYFRVSVLSLRVPPLRERRDDIPDLVRCFLERAARREGRIAPQPSPRAMQVLQTYSWPGNVRELRNVCERAAALCTGGVIEAGALSAWLGGDAAPPEIGAAPRRMRHGHLMEDMERDLIERTLVQYNGHREKTARALGIGVRTLGMKLKQWREEAAAAEARLAAEAAERRAG